MYEYARADSLGAFIETVHLCPIANHPVKESCDIQKQAVTKLMVDFLQVNLKGVLLKRGSVLGLYEKQVIRCLCFLKPDKITRLNMLPEYYKLLLFRQENLVAVKLEQHVGFNIFSNYQEFPSPLLCRAQ